MNTKSRRVFNGPATGIRKNVQDEFRICAKRKAYWHSRWGGASRYDL